MLATTDLDGTFERLQAGGAEVVQEPTEQPYGVRDCAFRDPAGNHDPHPRAELSPDHGEDDDSQRRRSGTSPTATT